jgi:hypothetical protein
MYNTLRILVVEDDPAIERLGLVCGHCVTYATHSQAQGLLLDQQFDLVLTDRVTEVLVPQGRATTLFGFLVQKGGV